MLLARGPMPVATVGLEFIDLADVDPASERDVFSKEEHFAMDWSKSGGQEWSYQGYTVNARKYPHDPRLHLPATHVWMRRCRLAFLVCF